MKWIIIFLIIMCIVHIYLHFIVHIDTRLSTLNEITREEITNTVYFKLPFIIDSPSLNLQAIDIATCEKISKRQYTKPYDSIPLLEPLVKFFTQNTIYELKKGKKISTHTNLECRNFYIIHTGNVYITLINPNNKDELRLELSANKILFVPNYWSVHIKSIELSIVEKLQYTTIMNHANFLWDYLINIKTCPICI